MRLLPRRWTLRRSGGAAQAATATRAEQVARDDIARAPGDRLFSRGNRPVIRWVKGDGLDDDVTRVALLAATRLFGREMDYCLCTNGIDAARARGILAWAEQPVEWWPVTPDDNPELALLLQAADADPEMFGYWWKWFPERVRPAAPEWILDGDMVVTGRPAWFDEWAAGGGPCRISVEDSNRHSEIYGDYADVLSPGNRMYSGLVALPPDATYMQRMAAILTDRPLVAPHDGRHDMSEQGVVAGAFERLGAVGFPLSQFPFARGFEADLDYGSEGDRGVAWGYHFGHSFRARNPHFEAMVASGQLPSREPTLVQSAAWLGGYGQWGVPGWVLGDECTGFIVDVASAYAGREVLEIGTSRGHLTMLLDAVGCRVTTVDHVDRGAAVNLAGTEVRVVVADGREFLAGTDHRFDLIVIDRHGNSEGEWRRWAPVLTRALAPGGRLVISNLTLAEVPEWPEESGVEWLVRHLPPTLVMEQRFEVVPGVAVLRRA